MEHPYQSRILDHLGLVAAMFDELELGTLIDQRIKQDTEQRTLSIGQAVKAMVLNGLGFVNQRLYLVPRFFETKPTERLLGPGIEPEHVNDDTLGRALDSLYETGLTELFRDLAAHAAAKLDLAPRFAHLDATSFHVDGRYNSDEESVEDGLIHIRQGYSRDHRPELNQVVLALMVEHRAGLPILMQPLSGNSSDAGSFPQIIEAHLSALQQAHGIDYVVADAALYSGEHLQYLDRSGTRFISRVPETVGEAKAVLAQAAPEAMEPLGEGYQALEHRSDYGNVAQRWLVVHSEAAQKRATSSVKKHLARKHAAELKAFKKLQQRVFSCRADAERALEAFEEGLVASMVEAGHVLDCAHVTLTETTEARSYRLRGTLVVSAEREAQLIWRKSLFIVATNELDAARLSAEALLSGYKGQHKVERGFRFLKDPLFLASSLFLKNERRIMALLMVMTLCLLVYAALQWRIREGLRQQDASIPDQKGKATARPTARWVFYTFEGIHVLLLGRQQLVLNLKPPHEVVLSVLGPDYQSYYASRAP